MGCNSRNNDNKVYTLENLQGEWLQKDYVNKLIEYKSPYKAEKEVYDKELSPLWCKIKQRDGKFLFSAGAELHFADWTKVTVNGLAVLNESEYTLILEGEPQSSINIKTITASEIILDIVDRPMYYYKPQYMMKIIGDRNEFINKVVLAGNYITENGVTCSFSVDGWATLPYVEQKFQYEIATACTVRQGDWFWDKTNVSPVFMDVVNKNIYIPDRYIFEWIDDKLYIYKDGGGAYAEVPVPTGNPIILTKID
jgi:hypothetical protein